MRTVRFLSEMMGTVLFTGLTLAFILGSSDPVSAQPTGSPATTESFCNIGMVKDQHNHSCEVPIPKNCKAANFPGTDKKWTNVSTGGKVSCQIDSKKSDWKNHIVGSCGVCKTKQCSARFSVMFQCGDEDGASNYKPQVPLR